MRELFCDVEVIQDFDRLNQTLVLKEEENNQSVTIKGNRTRRNVAAIGTVND
jgi:hypothetical protein